MSDTITIQSIINAPIQIVWDSYNNPEDIQKWNQASPDWHCPNSENDLSLGGKFKHTMAAKDGSFSFDFSGTYLAVHAPHALKYQLDDQRLVAVEFKELTENSTEIVVQFEPENMNPVDMQKAGWQAILDSFKNYTENQKS